MKTLCTMLLSAGVACTLLGQDSAPKRFTVGPTLGLNYADARAFTNNTMALGAEATLHMGPSESLLQTRAYLGAIRTSGKDRPDLGTAFGLSGLRAGVDLMFKTPLSALQAYAGLNLTKWSATSSQPSTLPNGGPEPTTSFPDKGLKFGWRLGVDYRFTDALTLGVDFNQSEWRHNNQLNTRPVKGLNPVNPSWVGITLRYGF